jgi:hypothetical protein
MIIRIDDYFAKQYYHVFRGVYVTYRLVLDWMIGFIDTLYTPLGTQAITVLSLIYTLYSSPLYTHKLGFSVFTSRILATHFNTGTITVSLNHILQISLYYRTPKDFFSLSDFQLSTELSRFLHLRTASSGSLNPILLLPSSIAWQAVCSLETQLTQTIFFVIFITPRHGPRKRRVYSFIA